MKNLILFVVLILIQAFAFSLSSHAGEVEKVQVSEVKSGMWARAIETHYGEIIKSWQIKESRKDAKDLVKKGIELKDGKIIDPVEIKYVIVKVDAAKGTTARAPHEQD